MKALVLYIWTLAAFFLSVDFPAVLCEDDQLNRVIVSYKNTDALAAARIRPDMVHYQLDDTTIAATFSNQAAIEDLRDDPTVEFVEPDPIRFLMMHSAHEPVVGSLRGRAAVTRLANTNITSIHPHRRLAEQIPYGIRMVQADTLSAGASVRTVCVIDSGYALGHEDLPSATGYNDGRWRWDEDPNGHGTHVAGTIAAIRNNGIGVIGVVDNVKLHIIRALATGRWTFASDLVYAIQRCRDAGAGVINMSFGGPDPSTAEQRALDSLYGSGLLLIGSAGNHGTEECFYPSAYPSVIAVAAVDETKTSAMFSPFHSQIELTAPGVRILSTVPLSASAVSTRLDVDGNVFPAAHLIGSSFTSAVGPLVNCGLAIQGQDTGSCGASGAANSVCLIERGGGTFASKVQFCERSGGIAAIIYNNVADFFAGTLGDYSSSIPAIGTSQSIGQLLRSSSIGKTASISVQIFPYYASLSGTSMSAPHVSGVAALLWSHHPTCTATQIRDVMACTAQDLGARGHDHFYGYGLVQAQAALDRLNRKGCNTCQRASSLERCGAKIGRGLRTCPPSARCDCRHNQCFTIYRVTQAGSCQSSCAGGIVLRIRLRLRYNCGECPSTNYDPSLVQNS